MRTAIGRLKRRAEFLQVAASRRKYVTPGLVLQAMPRPDDGQPRVGFTATRKLGGAVVRNRARRRLRAAAQAILPVAAAPGYDYVLIARAGTITRPWTLLLEDLRKAIEALTSRRPTAQ
ncbi:MAG TPA: ribonuclease P protein component [Alphaproteobacteria bacterium]